MNEDLGDILTRPTIETIVIAKRIGSNFVQFLQTSWGRLLGGMVIGYMVVHLLDRIYSSFPDPSYTLTDGSWFATLIGGVSGWVLYPHKIAASYMAYGTVLATIMMLLYIFFGGELTGEDIFLSFAMVGLPGGILLGAIVSRIQHHRKKI